MLPSIQQELTLSVPLSLNAHHSAQQFYQQHADNLSKAKQVYLNALAVHAVHTYLTWIGVKSNLRESDSWDPIMQSLSDVSDLEIAGQGKLECRPLLPAETECSISLEISASCIGYIPVRLNAALTTATLIGFMPADAVRLQIEKATPSEEVFDISLDSFESVTSLFDYVYQPEQTAESVRHATSSAAISAISSNRKRTALREWIGGAVDSSWQTVETLLAPQFAFSFRSLEASRLLDNSSIDNGPIDNSSIDNSPIDNNGPAIRGKLLKLISRYPTTNQIPKGDLQPEAVSSVNALPEESANCQVALIVGISSDNSLQSNIFVKLCPAGRDRYLPEGLEIRILDAENTSVMEAQARQVDMLQLNFKGIANERFAVKVTLGDVDLVEDFTI